MVKFAPGDHSDPTPRLPPPLERLIRQQYGHVTRRQLHGAGIADGVIYSWCRRGRLRRVHRGVYAVGYRRTEPIAVAAAAVLAGGPGAVLSHGSAAALWGLSRTWPDPPEVTTPQDRRAHEIRWHRTAGLHPREVRIHKGIRTTSAARTLLDLAPRLTEPELVRMVNDARIARWIHEQELRDLCDRRRTHPGARRLRATLGDSPTRSALEDRFPAFARRHQLPPYRVNARIAGLEVDIVFDAERVIVELDGWEFHRGHAQFTGDRTRDAVTLEAGYVTVRLTAAMLGAENGAATARRLHAILARRRTELGLT